MNVLIFIIVIVVLIVVHELGHFIVAKWSGMRVDEFGLGYPPRALLIKKIGDTEYTLNWLPFGGFVKIYGEDGLSIDQARDARAFSSKTRFAQALVLVAGVAMNFLLAYILIAGALLIGTPRALSDSELLVANNVQLAVASVLPDSPASQAGIVAGDFINSASISGNKWQSTKPSDFTPFISASNGETVSLSIKHDGKEKVINASPRTGVIPKDPSRYALGVEIVPVGVLPLSFKDAVTDGAHITWGATIITAKGLWHFFAGVFTLSANWAQVAGPVGIAGAVGTASASGWGELLSLVAIISINLAIINLIPVPALDGGRLLFVIIEAIVRRPINATVTRTLNAVSFLLLILLMVVVTAHDIFKIVG